MFKRFLAAAALMLLAGCDLPLASDDNSDLVRIRASADAPVLTLANTGRLAVHYMVFDRSELGIMLWAPCTPDQPECPTLRPGQTVQIPYVEIGAYDPGDTQAVVYWWIDEPAPEGGSRTKRQGDLLVQL